MTSEPAHDLQQVTPRQEHYLRSLAVEAGYADAQTACLALGVKVPTTKEEATAAISALEERVHPGEKGREDAKKARYLTPRLLRRIDTGELLPPSDLDEDAAWCLQRLAKLRELERVIGTPAQWGGVNQRGPILMAHLTEYFGSLEAVASAFGVSVPTARAWGAELPAVRAWEAQVKTRNHVCA